MPDWLQRKILIMKSTLAPVVLAVLMTVATPAFAQDRVYPVTNTQISAPVGLTVQVTNVTVAENATTVSLVVSFDAQSSRSIADLNGYQNAFISWSDIETDRIYMRRVVDNPSLSVENGQSMEGELVFPGAIPDSITEITLVFNPTRPLNHPRSPGIILPVKLSQ